VKFAGKRILSELLGALFAFAFLSEQGQELVEKTGYVSLKG
jgi:hypothetical protein